MVSNSGRIVLKTLAHLWSESCIFFLPKRGGKNSSCQSFCSKIIKMWMALSYCSPIWTSKVLTLRELVWKLYLQSKRQWVHGLFISLHHHFRTVFHCTLGRLVQKKCSRQSWRPTSSCCRWIITCDALCTFLLSVTLFLSFISYLIWFKVLYRWWWWWWWWFFIIVEKVKSINRVILRVWKK